MFLCWEHQSGITFGSYTKLLLLHIWRDFFQEIPENRSHLCLCRWAIHATRSLEIRPNVKFRSHSKIWFIANIMFKCFMTFYGLVCESWLVTYYFVLLFTFADEKCSWIWLITSSFFLPFCKGITIRDQGWIPHQDDLRPRYHKTYRGKQLTPIYGKEYPGRKELKKWMCGGNLCFTM